MSNLGSYQSYKPSGVGWLGDVPAPWEVRRTKTILKERSQKGFPEEPLLAATQTKGVVRKELFENRTVLALKDLHLLKLVREGDFVISLRSFQGGIEYAREQGIISPAYTVLHPRNAEVHAYLAWLFKSSPYIENLTLHVTGIREGQNIDYSELSRSHLPLPPLPEQAAIVRYLDHANDRIQRYVAAQRKLISLMEEEKQAIVNRAVTRGLDPNVRLKPSGVEWLGYVPEHWGVRRLKTICGMKSGEGITAESIEDVGEYPVYGGNGLRGYASSYTHDGAFALIGRQGALCGNVHIARGRFWASEHAVVAALNGGHEIGWFGAILTAMNLNQYSIAAAQPGLAVERVLNLHLPVPPPQEQKDIANHIEMTSTDIDAAITRARRQIELVEEYRIRLVADVVTGKLNVREAAAQLPEEAEDRELIEECGPLSDSLDEEIYDAEEEPAIAEEVRI